MEDVLEVYTRAYGEDEVLVCMDETTKQQIREVRRPMGTKPGRPARFDAEYQRNGVSNLFLFFAPLEEWRRVDVTDRRTQIDWAHAVRRLVDEDFPHVRKITLVMDNLNVHSPASLYAAFAPAEARRILERLEIHYTPRHGSWLNMAEIELRVLSRQCLSRRIPDQKTLRRAVWAWAARRNKTLAKVDWRFTTENARIKLRKLYPSFEV